MAHRLSPFLEIHESGALTLIGAGGEAVVFGDPVNQQVIKLCGPPAQCHFGWVIRRAASGILTLTPGDLDEILDRLSLFEALFPSGISIDCIGENDAFLAFRQPFIVGRHPTVAELSDSMHSLGWLPHQEPCSGETLKLLTPIDYRGWWVRRRWVRRKNRRTKRKSSTRCERFIFTAASSVILIAAADITIESKN